MDEDSPGTIPNLSPDNLAPTAPDQHQPITFRALLLGFAGAVFIAALQVVYKVSPGTVILPFHSALTLFPGVISVLVLLSLLNIVLRRFLPRSALRPSEFAVVFAITSIAAGISAQDEVQYLAPMFVYPQRASEAVQMGPFRHLIPKWLAPQSPAVVEPYYLGHGTFWKPDILAAWALPLLCWLAWLTALGATMWAWNVILRRRWVDHDRLAFPSLQLPLEICREAGFGGMVSGRVFWAGLLLSAAVELLNRLHGMFPAMPSIALDYTATPVLDHLPSPWKALSPMVLTWSTLFLGVAYFIPLDILFSGWFFYLFRKALEVVGYAAGWRDLGWDARGFPFTRSQAAGAWAALFVMLVWAERKRLYQILLSGFRRDVDVDDAEEPGSYRWAARILVGGTLFLVAWSVASGMSLGLAVLFYVFFWILNVTMTRVFAQVGPPFLELYYLDPQKTITTILGTFGQSPRSLTLFSLMYWINRDDRGQPMAHQLAALKVGKTTNLDPRGLGRWVLPAFVVGCVTCLITYLHWAYRVGEDQFVEGGWREAAAGLAVSRINQWVGSPKGPQAVEIAFMLVGAAVTFGLGKLTYSVVGCPFHPIGYALAVCFAMEYDWPAFLAIWIVKTLLLRYGGRSMFIRGAPFFLGLVLGGLVTPVVWGFLNFIFGWYH